MAKKFNKTASRKQRIVGSQTFMDTETGELVPMLLQEVEDRDFNFTKMWLQNFLNSIESMTNKKMDVAFWVISHLDSENKCCYTQEFIADDMGISASTVKEAFRLLQEGKTPFLVKRSFGVYIINPDILFKGKHERRMGIVMEFCDVKNANDKKAAEKAKKESSN